MPKAGGERAAVAAAVLAHIIVARNGKAYRSALTSGSSFHCRHPDDNDVDACTHNAEGRDGERDPSTKL
jgi:hypothetical protein